MLPAAFELAVRKIGLEVTGRAIAGPSLAEDGKQEVILENLVLVLDRNVRWNRGPADGGNVGDRRRTSC
jgi:hypothetical protein